MKYEISQDKLNKLEENVLDKINEQLNTEKNVIVFFNNIGKEKIL